MASGDLLILLKWFGKSICLVSIIIKENTHIIWYEICIRMFNIHFVHKTL